MLKKFILIVVLSFIIISTLQYFNNYNSVCWIVAFAFGTSMAAIK